jgi:predicted nucleic-acid-binding protein
MIAIDTNVLLRAVVADADDPDQCARARDLVKQAGRVRIAAIVFTEALWVLHKSYKASRMEVTRVARELLDHPLYHVEQTDLLREALEVFADSNVDFADAIALTDARRANIPLHTFDRKLARLSGAVAC